MDKYLQFDFDLESDVIGIVSSLSNYRLARFINEYLNIKLKRIEDHEVFQIKKGLNIQFTQFYFKDYINKREYYLIKNKEHIYSCLPEFVQFDYLFLSPRKIEEEILKRDESLIKTINNVQITKIIYTHLIKNKQNIYLDADTF